MNKFELLKVPEHFRNVDHYLGLIASVNKYNHLSQGQILSDDINSSTMLFLTYYLLGKKSDTITYAQFAVSKAIPYFEGDWRNLPFDKYTSDPAKWNRIKGPWISEFIYSMICALFIEDYESAKRIAAYPDEDCKCRFSTPWEEWACYLLLASLIKGEGIDNRALQEKIVNGKKKKPKLILPVLQSILENDSEKFNKRMTEYLEYFRKIEFTSALGCCQSFDGSILFYCGKMFGLSISEEIEKSTYLIV